MIVLVPRGAARPGLPVALDEEESHHLRVRRAAPGETVELRDGAGLAGAGVLESNGRVWSVTVSEASTMPPLPGLTLAVGAGDRERFLWLVEKAAELGVSRIVPIESERTAGVATRVRATHLEKLARRALEATKQSGAHWSPDIAGLEPFAQFVAQARSGALWLAEAGASSPQQVGAGDVTVLIGPEGGLTSAERSGAIGAGWTPVSLGTNVLRFETAAIAAAAYVAIQRQGRI
ncbi:MAG TPA: RsmE family RNA methyltransferase [Gemmatimonadales bacterium]|nr:RsmE family RNA methyltransferase [Gemmatimonadales bacterium]